MIFRMVITAATMSGVGGLSLWSARHRDHGVLDPCPGCGSTDACPRSLTDVCLGVSGPGSEVAVVVGLPAEPEVTAVGAGSAADRCRGGGGGSSH